MSVGVVEGRIAVHSISCLICPQQLPIGGVQAVQMAVERTHVHNFSAGGECRPRPDFVFGFETPMQVTVDGVDAVNVPWG